MLFATLSADYAASRLLCAEAAAAENAAAENGLWKDFNPMLIDGFNSSMPDTPDNRSVYPQQSKSQKPGSVW